MLQLEAISKSFPGVRALSGIDLNVPQGEIHALLGENGAGKSTLMKILSGIYHPDEGRILIDGVPRRFASYRDAVAAGVGIVFQEFSLIPDLDAVDNIFLGRELTRLGLLDRAGMRRAAAALFARLGVRIPLATPVCRLSVAQQQFIEIAKALAVEARILILDEPTATLTPAESAHLFTVMRTLKAQGVAIIFISHHLEEIFEVCDRITVLRDGQFVAVVDVAATSMAALVQMMVGRRIETSFPPKAGQAGHEALAVEGLQIAKDGPTVAFTLRQGEILGFAGLVGSGRTETVLAVLGATPAHRKTVRVNGSAARLDDPADALALGIGILPESRKADGLITSFAIRENISINNLGKYLRGGVFVASRAEAGATLAVMRQLGIKAPGMQTRVETLSGGNQQKVVLARWLNHQIRILIFDEPTRGIDVGAKAEIYALMRGLTEQGYAILMVSSELPEIVGLCDRVAVFREGRIVRMLEGAAITPTEVMRHATAGEALELA